MGEAEREKDIAQLEVVDRIREHEAIKLIRIKEGLFKVILLSAFITYFLYTVFVRGPKKLTPPPKKNFFLYLDVYSSILVYFFVFCFIFSI